MNFGEVSVQKCQNKLPYNLVDFTSVIIANVSNLKGLAKTVSMENIPH